MSTNQRRSDGTFEKGNGGRPKGARNKVTNALKEAILEAGAQAGLKIDPDAEDGLLAYLIEIAEKDHKAFCGLLGKVLPMTVAGDDGGPVEMIVHIGTKPGDAVAA